MHDAGAERTKGEEGDVTNARLVGKPSRWTTIGEGDEDYSRENEMDGRHFTLFNVDVKIDGSGAYFSHAYNGPTSCLRLDRCSPLAGRH